MVACRGRCLALRREILQRLPGFIRISDNRPSPSPSPKLAAAMRTNTDKNCAEKVDEIDLFVKRRLGIEVFWRRRFKTVSREFEISGKVQTHEDPGGETRRDE